MPEAMQNNTAIINLSNITKHYEMGSQIVKALDGINIAVEQND